MLANIVNQLHTACANNSPQHSYTKFQEIIHIFLTRYRTFIKDMQLSVIIFDDTVLILLNCSFGNRISDEKRRCNRTSLSNVRTILTNAIWWRQEKLTISRLSALMRIDSPMLCLCYSKNNFRCYVFCLDVFCNSSVVCQFGCVIK